MRHPEPSPRLRRAVVVAVAVLAVLSGMLVGSAAKAQAPSRCSTDPSGTYSCTKNTFTMTIDGEVRTIDYQLPLGTAPTAGWPVAFYFQGTNYVVPWSAAPNPTNDPYIENDRRMVQTLQGLLDAGYAVIAPLARSVGYYDTNVAPYATNWTTAPDHHLMLSLFVKIDAGSLGPLNGNKMFATGISSGGYMSDRATLTYPTRFKAIAIQSASYETCLGPLCIVPAFVPSSHAPTLFLHGAIDTIVPVATMYAYNGVLVFSGITTRVVVDPRLWHQVLLQAPTEIVSWFNAYR